MMNNYKYGGGIENENAEMVMNNNNQIKHHTEELEKIVTPETEVPAWVVSKVGRSASDLSDATHYLDGVSKIKYADGGSIPNNYDGKAVRHIWNSWSVSQRKHFLHDHSSNEVQDSYGEYRTEYLSEVEIENLAEVNYEDLPQDIKTKVFIHTDMGQYADGGVAYNPVWAEMEAYSPYSSRSEYENKKEYDDLAFASKSFSKSAEILVKENLMNGEICICKLRKILGHEPAYPIQYVGSIKLTKCFLKPFYKI